MTFAQWDIVRVRINPEDRDEHPAVIFSPDEHCADERRPKVNVLYCTTRRPGAEPRIHEVVLNGADGLEHPTIVNCAYFYSVPRLKISGPMGRVSLARRRQIIGFSWPCSGWPFDWRHDPNRQRCGYCHARHRGALSQPRASADVSVSHVAASASGELREDFPAHLRQAEHRRDFRAEPKTAWLSARQSDFAAESVRGVHSC